MAPTAAAQLPVYSSRPVVGDAYDAYEAPQTKSAESATSEDTTAQSVYRSLSPAAPDDAARQAGGDYLRAQLALAQALPCDLPSSPSALQEWIAGRVDEVGKRYAAYLAERKAGAPRRYFSNKSHALYFLNAVAPTKLVDGSWLYSTLRHWEDVRLHPLVLTYLEELGDGDVAMNHITLYKKLLATHHCEDLSALSDAHFVQGAIQLALAYQPDDHLPEVIGYNLGYEQLPLHLLITAYELNELGIDPYYFTLHVTIDNASTGHAHKAAQVVQELATQEADPDAFYRRICDGYRLNDLGLDTVSIIDAFDLEEELVAILQAKAEMGKNMHSDYCRFAGKTVNEWLQRPEAIRQFLAQLEKAGWIKRGEAPQESRFWRLINDAGAEMFGVFSPYEQQVLSDWITASPTQGDAQQEDRNTAPSFRAMARMRANAARAIAAASADANASSASPRIRLVTPSASAQNATGAANPAPDIVVPSDLSMPDLIAALSPGHHHTPEGLEATKLFSKIVRG